MGVGGGEGNSPPPPLKETLFCEHKIVSDYRVTPPAYFTMVTVPHKMVGLESMLDYRGVGLLKCDCSLFVRQLVLLTCQSVEVPVSFC